MRGTFTVVHALVGGSFTVLRALSNMESISLCVSLLEKAGLKGKHNRINSNANGPKSSQYSVNPGMIESSGLHKWAILRNPMLFSGPDENQLFMFSVSGVSKSGRGTSGPFVKVQMYRMT